MDLPDLFKDAIARDGRTLYALAKASGVDTAVLYRFTAGQRGISLTTAEALRQTLGLEIRLVKKAKKQ